MTLTTSKPVSTFAAAGFCLGPPEPTNIATSITRLHEEAEEAMGLDTVFWSEVLGTGMLTLLGVGVVANVLLGKTKGKLVGSGGNWLLINFGWALAVMAGVLVAYKSGAHLNPAVTLGFWAADYPEYAPGVEVDFQSTMVYLGGELTGAFLGAVVAWAAYKDHYD